MEHGHVHDDFADNVAYQNMKQGSIEVITGSMFSGKTEELLRRLRRARFAKLNIKLFKPSIDNRYSTNQVVSHDANAIDATLADCATDILNHAADADVVGIDEAQFFKADIVDVCKALAENGCRVIIAGLDMDFMGKPFGPMPQLMAIANDVLKVHAICVQCGSLAQFSHRTSGGRGLVVIGETNHYEPLCRRCYAIALKG